MKKLVIVVLFALANGIVFSQTFQPNDWAVDGIVLAAVAHPNQNKVFIGGDFHYVGPVISQQNAVALDATTGAVNTAFPVVDGVVDIVISDGVGGWYIGGTFTQVGGVSRNSLARINANGAVLSFNPNPTSGGNEGSVSTLARSGDTLFVGGGFDEIGGAFRTNLAAVSIATGNAFSWNVSLNEENGGVDEIVVSPTSVFIAGGFTDVGGEAIANIAEIDRVTGLPDISFPTTDGGVGLLALSGDTLFVGGNFTMVGESIREILASINHVTNTVTAWHPSPDGAVTAMLAHGNSLYIGGEFSMIAGENRSFCVQFTVDDVTLTNWGPNGYNCSIAANASALAFANGAVYVGGTIIASIPGLRGPAAFDSATGTLTNWHPAGTAGSNPPAIRALAISGTQVYVSGIFTSIGGKARDKLAAIDIASGTATDWNVGAVIGSIHALALTGNTLFVGGSFSAIGCLPSRQGLAALDASTGEVLSWQADLQDGTGVDAMKISGSTLYVGGTFDAVSGQSRHRLAAINTSTAFVESWNPDPAGSGFVGINVLEVVGTTVYVGGYFSSIGGASRNNFAGLDATTGLATSFDAGSITPAFGSIYALKASASGTTLYVGGNFTQISGQSRRSLCAYDLSTLSLAPTLTSWNPAVNGIVLTLLPANASVYVGGNFDSVGTEKRRGLASVNTSGSGLVLPFDPDINSAVNTIESYGTSVFAGGYADSVSSQYHPGIARFIDPSLPIQLGSFTATLNQQHHVVLNWMTFSEINNYGFFVQSKRESVVEWSEIPDSFIPGHGTTNEPHHYTFTDATAMSGRWHYRLKQVDLDGTVNFTEPVTVEILTEVADDNIPAEFSLQQNYPNPFNPSTIITFSIAHAGAATLRVFNTLGQEVATLVNEVLNAGHFEVSLNATDYASGVYFYRLQSGGFVEMRKMLLMK